MPSAHITYTLNAPVNGLMWLNDTMGAITGDGRLILARPGMEKPLGLQITESPLLALTTTPEGFVTGSESGEVHLTTPQGETRLLANTKHMFLEHLAYFPKKNQILAATGKKVMVINQDGTTTTLPHQTPSTIAGMALSPLGPRLAVSHYGGVTIMALDTPKNPPRLMPWKGSHLALTYSPDGKWLISSMQEQAIHLWRLSDSLDLQMRGYPSKITQFSWNSTNTSLGTNGGSGVPMWDFSTEKGPAGTQAKVVADSASPDILVTAMQMHPKGPFCAIGYSDGLTLLANTAQESAIMLHQPNQNAITHVAWAPTGLFLASADSEGTLTLTDFAALA